LIIIGSVLALTVGQIVFPDSTSDFPQGSSRQSGRSLHNCVTNEQKTGTCMPLTQCLADYTQLSGLIQQVIVDYFLSFFLPFFLSFFLSNFC